MLWACAPPVESAMASEARSEKPAIASTVRSLGNKLVLTVKAICGRMAEWFSETKSLPYKPSGRLREYRLLLLC
jgi:hypothetical protein